MGKLDVDLETLVAGGLSVDAVLAESIERVIWDKGVLGLGLRCRRGWQPRWIVQRRLEGRTVKRTLGDLDRMDLSEARDAARNLFDDLGKTLPAASPTLAAFIPVFLDDCAGRWKPSTLSGHRSNLMSMVLPALGEISLHALTRANVVTWFEGVGAKTASGNRALSVLSLMIQHAELLGLRPKGSNPCIGLQYRRSHFEARYLTGDDFVRLGGVLKRLASDHPVEVAAIRFLLLTGARRGEVLALEWPFIEGARAVLPDSKTGPKTLWLCKAARRLLASLACPSSSRLVFAHPDGRSIKNSLLRIWHRVRTVAALGCVRLHDLRHSYASIAVSTGEELRTVAGLLGHADLGTTAGYAHLVEKPVAEAAGRVSRRLADAMIPSVPVTPIRPQPPKPPRPSSQPKPEPILPPEPPLPERDKPWVKHIEAFHRSPLRLDPFCAEQGLDPKEMGQALARHFKRRKERAAQLAVLS
ncbi:MAG: tyrosine-type recombinase/integrase [Geminicoccaceae bacterium]